MSDLEQYLKKNSRNCEHISVDPDIWTSVEKRLIKAQKRKSLTFTWIKIAAAVVFLAASSIILKSVFQKPKPEIYELAHKESRPTSIESDYQFRIDTKVKELKSMEIPKELKSNFKLLIDEFHKPSETVLREEEMITFYHLKLRILNRIEKEIKKINHFEKELQYENKKILLPI